MVCRIRNDKRGHNTWMTTLAPNYNWAVCAHYVTWLTYVCYELLISRDVAGCLTTPSSVHFRGVRRRSTYLSVFWRRIRNDPCAHYARVGAPLLSIDWSYQTSSFSIQWSPVHAHTSHIHHRTHIAHTSPHTHRTYIIARTSHIHPAHTSHIHLTYMFAHISKVRKVALPSRALCI